MIRIGGYVIDAAISEEESLEAEVTEYPVESGAVITDHVRNRPRTLDLEFKVSDTPIGEVESARAAGVVPSSEARQVLEELRATRRPFTVITKTRAYESMVFTSLRFPRDGETGDALVGQATLQQLEIVDVRRVSVAIKKAFSHRAAAGVTTVAEGWLCPLGVGVSKNKAENLRNGCRAVVTRTNNAGALGSSSVLEFADTGVALSSTQISAYNVQKINTATGLKLPEGGGVYDPINKQWVFGVSDDTPVTKRPTQASTMRLVSSVDDSYQPPQSSDPLVNGINALGRGENPFR